MAVNRKVNALFLSWLQEWKDEAKLKESKMHYTYTKAIESMSRFPLMLTSGSDCNILKGFGDKICKMIDQKLEKEMSEQGWQASAEEFLKEHNEKVNLTKIRIKPRKKSKVNNITPVKSSGLTMLKSKEISDNNNFGKSSATLDQDGDLVIIESFSSYEKEDKINSFKSLKNNSNFKDHAISSKCLVDLSSEMPSNSKTQSSKLLASYSISSPSESWYLYVNDDGETTEFKDKAVVKVDESTFKLSFLIKAKYLNLVMSGIIYDIDYNRKTNNEDYIYAYIGDSSAPDVIITSKKINSPLKSSENNASFVDNSLEKKGSMKTIKISSPVEDKMMKQNDATTSANRFTSLLSQECMKLIYDERCFEDYVRLYDEDKAEVDKVKQEKKGVKSVKRQMSETNATIKGKKKKFEKCNSMNVGSMKNATSTSVVKDDDEIEAMLKGEMDIMDNLKELLKSKHVTHSEDWSVGDEDNDIFSNADEDYENDSSYDYFFKAGSFEILLCVDTREFNEKSSIVSELRKKHSAHDVRHLHLGDFLWVARSYESGVELVLDSIVERKSMNDLAGSVVDGRLKSQKMRLSRCGLKHVSFLIEGKASNNYCISQSALLQNVVNLQIIHGFNVKQVQDYKQSANFLSTATACMQSFYKNKNLYGYKEMKKARAANKKDPQANGDLYSIHLNSFEAFNSENMKAKKCSVSEMFAKMLIQFKGMSLARASSIVSLYPTSLKLYKAYESCENEEEKPKMLAKIPWGPSKKNIGMALSKLVANTYSR